MHTYQQKILFVLMGVVSTLAFTSIFFVYEASSQTALRLTGTPYYFVIRHVMWILLGYVILFIISRIHYRIFFSLGMPAIVISIILLIIVLIPTPITPVINGARRWITLGFIGVQPSEIAKVGLILYLASWFRSRSQKRFSGFIVLIGVLTFLVMLQPDMGTAGIMLGIGAGMYFLSGVELKKLFILIPVIVVIGLFALPLSHYRIKRLTAFLDPASQPKEVVYHTNQVTIALQNGHLWGLGLGASKQKNLYLPEAHTDSIFAIIVEETGFLGGVGILLLFLILITYLVKLISIVSDPYGNMIVSGTLLFFGIQSSINLAGMVGAFPLTGVPLSFVSYGGTHMLASFFLIGICISVARHR